MDRTRRTALVAGLFYLVTFAASIPAVFLLDPVLNGHRNHPDLPVGAIARRVAGRQGLHAVRHHRRHGGTER
jgi:hypothetical protein